MSTASQEIKLTGPETWQSWADAFESKAGALGIWDLIDPDSSSKGQWLTRPAKPDVSKYEKKHSADPPTSSSGASAASTQTVEGAASGPRSAAELTDSARGAYNSDMSAYTQEMREFKEQGEAIYKIIQWVETSVLEHYRKTSCKPSQKLDAWFANLKTHVGSDSASQTLAAEDKYLETLEKMRKPPKDPMEWIKAWEKVLKEAEDAQVASASDSISWWKALATAGRSAGFANFFDTYHMINAAQINTRKYDSRKIVNAFAQSTYATQAPPKRPHAVIKGSFPTYHGNNGSDTEEDERPRGRARERSNTRKRKRAEEEEGTTCRACGFFGHTLPFCFYVFPARAPEDFPLKGSMLAQVKERLERDDDLRAEVERLKKKRFDSKDRYRGRDRSGSRGRRHGNERSRSRGSRSRSRNDSKTRYPKKDEGNKKQVRFDDQVDS